MPLDTESRYNSVYDLAPEDNKLLSAINASTLRDENATPDEFAMQNYRGPSFDPKGRVLPTVKETAQVVGSLGSAVGGMIVGGYAGLGQAVLHKLGLSNITGEEALNYWQDKFAYYPSEPVAQRTVEAINLPFEALRFVADKAGHAAHDYLLNNGSSPEMAANLSATLALAIEFRILKFTNNGIKKIKGAGGAKINSAIGRLNETFRRGADEVTIKDAVSALKSAMKDEIPVEKLSEIQKDALSAIMASDKTPIVSYMDHIESLTSLGIVKAFKESKKVPKKAKKTKVKAEELKVGDVKEATEIIKEAENIEIVKPTIVEEKITYKSRSGNVYEKRDNQWFDKSGEVVTNRAIIKAAEKKQVSIKNIETEETIVEGKSTIPELNSSNEAAAFAKIATKEQLTEVERLRDLHGQRGRDLHEEANKIDVNVNKAGKYKLLDEATEETVKAQLYREVLEAKADPARFEQTADAFYKKFGEEQRQNYKKSEVQTEEPTTEVRSKITKTDKAETTAKAQGIEFVSEEMIDEFIRDTDTTPTKIPHYQFFDPVTGEYFLSRSPSSKVVAEELATLRELRSINSAVSKKLTFEDLNREANDIMKGVSNTKPEDFLKTLRNFTENIAEEDIGPGKRFETTADAMEHLDMGREFTSKFRREAIKRGLIEESGTQLNMMIPLDQIPALVKDWYKLGKVVGKKASEMFRDRELWLKTGFWLGKDNKWRYEIPEPKKGINVTQEILNAFKSHTPVQIDLQRLLNHPELYKAVPETKNIKVIYDPKLDRKGIYFNAQGSHIIFTKHIADKQILIHEIQHAVSDIVRSKFRGTSLSSERIKLNTKYKYSGEVPPNANDLEMIAYGNYIKNPGEMEARLTTKRMNMSEEQRKTEAPWETLDKMIKDEGFIEEHGTTLYSGFPIHLVKNIAKDINNTFKIIYRGLSERSNVKELKPQDAKIYEKMLADHEATVSSSEQRGIYEIGNDLNNLETFSSKGHFTIEQLKSIQLLESDAKRLHQPFNDYLEELGFTREQVQRVMNESAKWRNKIEPLDDTVPVEVSVDEVNPIVKQRQWKAKDKSIVTAPPIHVSDIRMMENAVELAPQVGFKTLGTMIRLFEETGLKPIYNAWREADANVAREMNAVDNFLNDIKSRYKLNRKSRQNIMTYAYQQQERGMKILEANRLKPVTLTPDEMNAYGEMRMMYEDYFERINAVRRSIGRDPIKKVDNYFTFARVINNLQREGIINNLIREDAELIMNQYTHFKSTPFRFARVRTGGIFNPELDSFKVFKMYSDTAARHINISPVAAKVNELVNTRIPLSDGSGSVQYSVVKPNTGRFLNDWSDSISGKPVTSKWPGWIGDRGLRMLKKNIAYSTLQWNVRSALIQPAAIQNSLTELGLKYVSEGFVDNCKPEMRNFAMKNSNHLITRVPETEISDWAYVGKIWKAGYKPMQLLDLETARTTWLGAYRFGREVHGLSGKELINFADDTVVRTQGSAAMGDIAVIQRSEMGKALTMFQTFTINNWDFITKDVLGLKGLKSNRPLDVQKVVRLVVSITALNILYEDIFGIPSPNPRPVKELIDGISDGESFGKIAMSTAKELLEPVPIIGGSFKYEKQIGGPVFELLSETGKKIADSPMQKSWLEILSMVSGIPGTRQIIKYQKGQKRGEGFTGSLLGTYSDEQGSSGRPSRSGRSSRGSR